MLILTNLLNPVASSLTGTLMSARSEIIEPLPLVPHLRLMAS